MYILHEMGIIRFLLRRHEMSQVDKKINGRIFGKSWLNSDFLLCICKNSEKLHKKVRKISCLFEVCKKESQ